MSASVGPLFRPEAALARTSRFGRVSLALPLSSWVLTLVLVAILTTVAAFLVFGRYARKETVVGYVTPSAGAVDVHASRQGVVDEVHVNLGDRVVVGDRLFSVRDSGQLSLDGDVSIRVGQRIERQIAHAVAERASVARLFDRRLERLDHALQGHAADVAASTDMVELARERLALAESSFVARAALARSDALPVEALRIAHGDWLSLSMEATRAEAERRRLESALPELRLQRHEAAAERDRQIATLDGRLDSLRGQLIEWRARASSLIVAPVSGVVAMTQVARGQSADAQTPAMTIIPEGSTLEVRLLIPSEAKAFVEPGQSVRLMYDAFPYQHFGTQAGVVLDVAGAAVAGHRVRAPVSAQRPVYLAVVRLEDDHVEAYGRRYGVQAGMTVRVDIVLAERRLIAWLLEPLLRVRG